MLVNLLEETLKDIKKRLQQKGNIKLEETKRLLLERFSK